MDGNQNAVGTTSWRSPVTLDKSNSAVPVRRAGGAERSRTAVGWEWERVHIIYLRWEGDSLLLAVLPRSSRHIPVQF
jgi:hypothetical protein